MKFLLCLLALAVAEINLDAPAVNQKLIDEVNSANALWTAGVNEHFVGTTLRYAKGLCGALVGGPKLPVKEIIPAAFIPDSFDPREEWGDICPCLKEVRDQAECGSCWAISAAEVMTDRHCIQTKGEQKPELSAQDVTSCCGYQCGQGCNGGYPSAAFEYWQETGVVTGGLYKDNETCYPYALPPCEHHTHGKLPDCGKTKPTPKCAHKCSNGAQWDEDKHFAADVYSVSSNMQKIQTELMTKGPIDAAFTVYEDFLNYKSGVYHHVSGSQLGGHAVKMIGWGVENGTPYWLIVNSWNEDWGMDGLFKIRRGKNECGIEGQLVTGTAKTE